MTFASLVTRPRLALTLWAGLLLAPQLAGCKAGPGTARPDDPTSQGGEADAKDPTKPAASGEPVVFASVGVPHGGAITMISLAPDARAALSRDALGGVRLWPALDGSREPLVVPIRDPRGMSLAASESGWTLALRDAAGGARVVSVGHDGQMQPLASLSPTEPLAELEVLPGGSRLLAVGNDHVLRLLDTAGTELARLDSPGLRLASIRLATQSEGGPRVFALTAGEFDSKQGRFAVEVIALELSEDKLALGAVRQKIFLDSPATRDNPTLAPDGQTVVYLQRQRLGGATWQIVATQLADGRQVAVDSEIAVGTQPRMGLMKAGRVLLDDGSGLGRVVDLRERHVELMALRSSPTLSHLVSTFAEGVRAAPAGNWLAVHDLVADDLIYLGYEQVNVNDAGLSPRGDLVAWALGDRLAVERLDESREVREVPGTRPLAQRFVGFLDDELLATIDWSGGAKLLRWRDGEVVDAVDLGNSVQMAKLARDGQGNGLILVRTNLWQNGTLVDLRGGEFGARHLTYATATFIGLLAPRAEPLDEWGAWTIDGAIKLRHFTLADLAAGLDTQSALERGEVLPAGMPEQFLSAPDGARFWVRTVGTHPTLYREHEGESAELALSPGGVSLLESSHDGRRLAVVQNRNAGQVVSVLDAASMQILWAQPIPPAMSLAWSDEGEALAVPAMLGGGVVLDGKDGSVTTARCGLAFELRRTPPINQGFGNQVSACDLQ